MNDKMETLGFIAFIILLSGCINQYHSGIIRDCEYSGFFSSECGQCFCLEDSGGCHIIQPGIVGNLSYAVNKTVGYAGELVESSPRTCVYHIKITEINVIS